MLAETDQCYWRMVQYFSTLFHELYWGEYPEERNTVCTVYMSSSDEWCNDCRNYKNPSIEDDKVYNVCYLPQSFLKFKLLDFTMKNVSPQKNTKEKDEKHKIAL